MVSNLNNKNMNSNQLVDVIDLTLRKHFITINSFELKIDSRTSKDFKAKINLLISDSLARELATDYSKLIEIMSELRNIDRKIIRRVQLYRSKSKKWSIKLFLSKRVSKIEKFTCRRTKESITALDLSKTMLKNRLQQGNIIKFLELNTFTEPVPVLRVGEKTVTLGFSDRTRNLPMEFFNNKQILIIN